MTPMEAANEFLINWLLLPLVPVLGAVYLVAVFKAVAK